MIFIKNFVLFIVFFCLVASFFITKEKKLEKAEIKTQSHNYNTNIESDNDTKEKENNSNKSNIKIENKKETKTKEQIIEEYFKNKNFSKEIEKIELELTEQAFSKKMIKAQSTNKPTEEFVNIVDSYQGEFVPLDILPETRNLCFDSNYHKHSFGIITIVDNNGVKEVYECVYTSEDSGKWVYRGLANNQN